MDRPGRSHGTQLPGRSLFGIRESGETVVIVFPRIGMGIRHHGPDGKAEVEQIYDTGVIISNADFFSLCVSLYTLLSALCLLLPGPPRERDTTRMNNEQRSDSILTAYRG